MSRKKAELKFTLEVETEERKDYFAARTKPFAITAYGNTEGEAEERAVQAVDLLVKTHVKTLNELHNFLTHRGVKHVVQRDLGSVGYYPTVVRSSTREMGVEVPVG